MAHLDIGRPEAIAAYFGGLREKFPQVLERGSGQLSQATPEELAKHLQARSPLGRWMLGYYAGLRSSDDPAAIAAQAKADEAQRAMREYDELMAYRRSMADAALLQARARLERIEAEKEAAWVAHVGDAGRNPAMRDDYFEQIDENGDEIEF